MQKGTANEHSAAHAATKDDGRKRTQRGKAATESAKGLVPFIPLPPFPCHSEESIPEGEATGKGMEARE